MGDFLGIPDSDYIDDIYPTESLILKFVSMEQNLPINGTALHNLTINQARDRIRDSILYKIHTLVPAENVKTSTRTLSVSVPDGWWQMFKDTYFTERLKKMFPVAYKTTEETVTFDAYVIYPQLPKVYDCGKTKQVVLQSIDSYKKVIE